MKNSNNSFFKDFSWYFVGSFFPLLIGFIKTPIFTRHFNKEEYGNLGLVSITFTFFGMFLFSWIGSCIWRFYNKYERKNKLKKLYSNLFFLYLLAIVILFLISFFWYLEVDKILVKQLIFYSFFQLFINQLFLFYMILVRLRGDAKFYTKIQTIRAIISVVLVLIMVFYFKENIAALISSLIIVDLIFVLYLIFYNPVLVKINLKLIHKNVLSEILLYGSVGLILNLSLLTITYSDRYIIAWFGTIEEVGIYDQVYKIAQLSVIALITIFFNTVNPFLLRELEINFDRSIISVRKYIRAFLIFGLPIIFYLSLFSNGLSKILLGEPFRVGHTIMPFIFISAYLHGISNFYELRLKFSNKLKKLSLLALGIAIFNISMNLIFIPIYGYQSAAVTTMCSYLILLLILHIKDNEIITFSKKNITFALKIVGILGMQLVLYWILKNLFEVNLIFDFSLGILYILSYSFLLKKQMMLTKF